MNTTRRSVDLNAELTNFDIIKGLPEEISSMAKGLSCGSQNRAQAQGGINFEVSIKVLGCGKQTALPRSEPAADALLVNKLKAKFNAVKGRLAQRRSEAFSVECYLFVGSASTGVRVYRRKASQQFNRYRVIDQHQPPPREKQTCRDKNRITAGATSSSRQTTASTSIRIRFSLKSHIKAHHEPSRAMKQYKLVPWKSKTETPENTSAMPIIGNSEEPKAPRRGPCLPAVERMTKAGLVKVLAWEHSFATLEIGTVDANVRSALTVKDVPQDLVVPAKENEVAGESIKCLRDIVKVTNRTKRRCQQLFGVFIDNARTDGSTPRDKIFFERLRPPIPPKEPGSSSNTTLVLPVINLTPDDDNNGKLDQSDKQILFIGLDKNGHTNVTFQHLHLVLHDLHIDTHSHFATFIPGNLLLPGPAASASFNPTLNSFALYETLYLLGHLLIQLK
ncbi:MAG: hypothetical protein J3R72DRAFT_512538 [Linnemannia gamsii]|nr:MAG: hypothetical protein J3R72DRAFT_512538 [Linnemannia gamsii]